MNTAIATHLNVAEAAIVEIQEWASVLWVRVKGLGARFVSKKVVKVKMENKKVAEFAQGIEEYRARHAAALAAGNEKKAARLAGVIQRNEAELRWMQSIPAAVFARLGDATTAASLVEDLGVAVRQHELATETLLPRP